MCRSDDGGAAEDARRREAERARNIGAGNALIANAFSQFNDGFFDAREQSYLDYALPQLDRQYEEAAKKLTLALARNGRLQSSTRGTQFAGLEEDFNLHRQGIQERAKGFANSARADIASGRANLMSQNASIADPSVIGSLALSSAEGLAGAPAFTPLGTLFQNVAAGLSTQSDLERRQSAQYPTGIFSTSGRGSSSVIQ